MFHEHKSLESAASSAASARTSQQPNPEAKRANGKRPLRVGFLLDSFDVPQWVEAAIQSVQASGVVDIVLVITRDVPAEKRSWVQKLRANHAHLLPIIYSRLDERLFRSNPDPFQIVNVRAFLNEVPALAIKPKLTRHSDYFEAKDIEAIRQYDLDVAVRFGFRILRGDALAIARFGVWSYHHGDNVTNRGGPAGFWEVMHNETTTGSILQILNENLDDGEVLYRSYSQTDRRSVWRNRRNYYCKSSMFLTRTLTQLHRLGGEAFVLHHKVRARWQPYSRPLFRQPRNVEMVALLLKLATRYVRDKICSLAYTEQWYLAFGWNKEAALSNQIPDGAPHRFHNLYPPRDRFWADPFPMCVNQRYFVFFEEYVYRAGKGHISVLELKADGTVGVSTKVLEREYHLSYPFVFEWRGHYYMIPETSSNRTVELFRASEFPYRWEFDRVLLRDVNAVDATVAEISGRFWLFVNLVSVPGASSLDELHIYYADSPLGPWQPHQENPVKSDVRGARPAGRLFEKNDHWYRPAQDCSRTYGGAVAIHQIVKLDITHFEEVEVSKLLPEWQSDLTGVHTINASGSLTVIDAKRWRARCTP